MQISKSKLIDWKNNIKGTCTFFACEGYRKPPLAMKTCCICSTVWEINQTLKGMNQADMDQKQQQYQEEWNNKR